MIEFDDDDRMLLKQFMLSIGIDALVEYAIQAIPILQEADPTLTDSLQKWLIHQSSFYQEKLDGLDAEKTASENMINDVKDKVDSLLAKF